MKEIEGWSAWADKYKPIPNKFSKHNELMYETYGEEVEHVQSMHPNFVWTLVDGDMCSLLIAGYHYVNRLGYYISENPWDDEDTTVLLSVERECECYDEETGEGKEDCNICEGYGLKTEYVG